MKFKGLYRKDYSQNADEAMPIGNGSLGGLVFANPLHETIITNHEEVFLPTVSADEDNDDLTPNPYETALSLKFDFNSYKESDVTDYSQLLNFENGEAITQFKVKGEMVTRKAFVSRSRDIMAVQVKKDGNPFSLDISIEAPENLMNTNLSEFAAEEDALVCMVTHEEQESGYIGAERVITDGQISVLSDRKINVSKANYVLMFYTIGPWKLRKEAEKVKTVRMLRDISHDYDALLKEHEAIHSDLFNKVRVEFDSSERLFTNEELIKECKEGKYARLTERLADLGRYLLIASLGKMPPTSQGIWDADTGNDITMDISYFDVLSEIIKPLLPGGLNILARKFLDWLENYTKDFSENPINRAGGDKLSKEALSAFKMLSKEYDEYYSYTNDENMIEKKERYYKDILETPLRKEEASESEAKDFADFKFIKDIAKRLKKNLFVSNENKAGFSIYENVKVLSVVYEMIAKTTDDTLEFFPLWPKDVDDLKVTGLRLKGVLRIKELSKHKDFFTTS
ncbi:MAG: glycoside hydrolase N-terminal domain-containing protein, partial [Lachnospiraceae bacterium]|nr:glycoside hydrolase N-terminal domain-containing protein [Lachnospiraceae bacterium]